MERGTAAAGQRMRKRSPLKLPSGSAHSHPCKGQVNNCALSVPGAPFLRHGLFLNNKAAFRLQTEGLSIHDTACDLRV